MEQIKQRLQEERLIAILRAVPPERAVAVAQALAAGGIHCLEVAYDQSSETASRDTPQTVESILRALGSEVLVGVGTVLTVRQVRLALDAGARYIISPNVDPSVIQEAKHQGAISMPGALTPTEITVAWQAGADIVKLFPSGDLGPGYLSSIRAPLRHIPIAAVGGISPDNAADFLSAGACCLGVGGNLISKQAVEAEDYASITAAAQRFRHAVDTWEQTRLPI